MAKYVLIPGDKARRAVDPETGTIISRRQYDKLYKTFGQSYEVKASNNLARNPALAVSRPARGRKSTLKLSEVERNFIAEARLEQSALNKVAKEREKQERATERLIERQKNKRHKKYQITTRLLKTGHKGRRIPFDDYEEYLEYYKEAKSLGKIKFYGLGVEGYHENTGKTLTATVFTMRTFDRPISETRFEDEMENAIEEWSYFVFTNYWMHLAFDIKYARERISNAAKRRQKARK